MILAIDEAAKGSQLYLDLHYEYSAAACEIAFGPHIFNFHDQVQHVDGRFGKVVRRTALTAVVRWMDGPCEEIPQFTTEVTVCSKKPS